MHSQMTPKNVVHIARLFVSKYKQGLGHFQWLTGLTGLIFWQLCVMGICLEHAQEPS